MKFKEANASRICGERVGGKGEWDRDPPSLWFNDDLHMHVRKSQRLGKEPTEKGGGSIPKLIQCQE